MFDSNSMSLKSYIAEKIRMLREDFKISLSKREIERLRTCQSEISVDICARSILEQKL